MSASDAPREVPRADADPGVGPLVGADAPAEPQRAAVRAIEVCHVGPDGRAQDRSDAVAAEEALELRVEGHPIAVVMRTPGDDRSLAIGFLWTEGVIERPADVRSVTATPTREGLAAPDAVDVRLAPGLTVDLASLERNLYAASSCGVCGKATLDAVLRRVRPLAPGPALAREALAALPERMRAAQPGFARTGGLHAAALFAADGALLALAEDVGRHNAVDKALGQVLERAGAPAVLCVSGRASFEIAQKAAIAGVPILVAVSAPSSLSIELARESGLTLIGFCRDGAFNIYAGRERVVTDAAGGSAD